MNDGLLLAYGCGVTFLAVAGGYVFVRARYLDVEPSGAQPVADIAPVPATALAKPVEHA